MATFGSVRKQLNNVLNKSAESFGKGGMEEQEIKTGRLVCSAANSIASSIHAELRARDQAVRNGENLSSVGKIGSMVIA